MGRKSDVGWQEKIIYKSGSKFLSTISNDNNVKTPEWVFRIWDISGQRKVKSFQQMDLDEVYDFYSDGEVYLNRQSARVALNKFMKTDMIF